jgi:hypothetical protein
MIRKGSVVRIRGMFETAKVVERYKRRSDMPPYWCGLVIVDRNLRYARSLGEGKKYFHISELERAS